MTRRIMRTPVHLHPANAKELPFEEIKAILCGADNLVASGGRSLLVKIVKGSREKGERQPLDTENILVGGLIKS